MINYNIPYFLSCSSFISSPCLAAVCPEPWEKSSSSSLRFQWSPRGHLNQFWRWLYNIQCYFLISISYTFQATIATDYHICWWNKKCSCHCQRIVWFTWPKTATSPRKTSGCLCRIPGWLHLLLYNRTLWFPWIFIDLLCPRFVV